MEEIVRFRCCKPEGVQRARPLTPAAYCPPRLLCATDRQQLTCLAASKARSAESLRKFVGDAATSPDVGSQAIGYEPTAWLLVFIPRARKRVGSEGVP